MTRRRHPPDFLLARIVHRDGLVLIIDKPAGLRVHAGPSGGESLEDYFDALRFGLPRLPALAHRLDRDTTGCLALGRHPKALRKLNALFRDGRAEKTYLALCAGAPPALSGAIDLPLAKVKAKAGWRMAGDERGGRPARTTYRTLARSGDAALIAAKPKTGRTHQIRVHLASLGAPILGDALYGEPASAPRVMLHARRLVLPLAPSRPPVAAVAPIPDDMLAVAVKRGLDAQALQSN